jgi:hypothetical protein
LWWRNAAIDPLAAARTLWLETHPPPRAEPAANEAAVNAETNESSVKRQTARTSYVWCSALCLGWRSAFFTSAVATLPRR